MPKYALGRSRFTPANQFDKLIRKHEPEMKLSLLERFAFYERVHGAYAVIQTGERRLYGNVLLKKGIVRPE